MRRAIRVFACAALLAAPTAPARAATNGMLAAVSDEKLVTLNADGSGYRVLWTPQDPGAITGLAWSPDGNRLAVAQGDRISVLDLSGTRFVVPQQAGVLRDANPAWGLDGARLGFRRTTANAQWATQTLPDGSPVDREQLPAGATELVWGPNLARWAITAPLGLILPGLDLPLVPAVVGVPAWSPDGTRIAFNDGTSLRTITTDLLGATTTVVPMLTGSPRWSPDGTSLVYPAGSSLNIVPAAGGEPRAVPVSGIAGPVDWQPCSELTATCISFAPPRCAATTATVTTQADQPVDIPPPPCSDPAERPLTLVVVKAPDHGTLAGRRYTPAPGFSGQDLVSYRVSNGSGESETVRVTIFVVPRPAAAVVTPKPPPPPPVGPPFLSARAKPKLDRHRRTSAQLYCDQNCAINLRLTARLRSRKTLKGPVVRHTLAAGKVLTVHLRLPAKPKGKVKTAWITGTVRNGAGNARTVKLPVTLPR